MPRPVQSGRKPIVKGTVMPPRPGLSQGSPSRVMPCTAIATMPASAVCSWIAMQLARETGRAHHLPRHRQPDPDRDRHQDQRDQTGSTAGEPPAMGLQGLGAAPSCRLPRGPGGGSRGWAASGPTGSIRPLSWTSRPPRSARTRDRPRGRRAAPPWRASPPRPRCRRARWRRSGRSRRARRSTGRAGGARSGRRASRQIRTLRPEVATAPEPSCST